MTNEVSNLILSGSWNRTTAVALVWECYFPRWAVNKISPAIAKGKNRRCIFRLHNAPYVKVAYGGQTFAPNEGIKRPN